jgi:hypothetical protein
MQGQRAGRVGLGIQPAGDCSTSSERSIQEIDLYRGFFWNLVPWIRERATLTFGGDRARRHSVSVQGTMYGSVRSTVTKPCGHGRRANGGCRSFGAQHRYGFGDSFHGDRITNALSTSAALVPTTSTSNCPGASLKKLRNAAGPGPSVFPAAKVTGLPRNWTT